MRPSPILPELPEGEELKRILLLVDYSNILYRSYFGSIKEWENRPWLPILRFLDSLRLCVQRSKPEGIPVEVIFAGESRQKLERSKIDPSYKSQRAPIKHDIFRKFRKVLALILRDMDTHLVSRPGAEADDIIASVVSYVNPLDDPPWMPTSKKTSTTTIVFSNDKDLYQLLKYQRCYIFKNPGVFYTPELFRSEYGFDPYEFTAYKAMIGDKSDNVSGVNGIGPVNAKKHILDGTVPTDDPEFIKSIGLIALNYDLDVPTVGDKLTFDFDLEHGRDYIFEYYGRDTAAFDEIQLAMKMLYSVYYRK